MKKERMKTYNQQEIKKIIEKWYANDICNGKPDCCIEECDLCMNCYFKLLDKFGLKWSLGRVLLKSKGDSKI